MHCDDQKDYLYKYQYNELHKFVFANKEVWFYIWIDEKIIKFW